MSEEMGLRLHIGKFDEKLAEKLATRFAQILHADLNVRLDVKSNDKLVEQLARVPTFDSELAQRLAKKFALEFVLELRVVYLKFIQLTSEKLNDELGLGFDKRTVGKLAVVPVNILEGKLDGRLVVSKISRLWKLAAQVYTTAFLDARRPGRKPLKEEITGTVDELMLQYDILAKTIDTSFRKLERQLKDPVYRSTVSNFFARKSFQFLRISRALRTSNPRFQVA